MLQQFSHRSSYVHRTSYLNLKREVRTKERNRGVKSTPIGGVSDVNDLRPSFHRYLCISTDGGCPRRLRFTKSARWACEIGDNFHQSSEAMTIQPVSVPEFNSIASDPFNFRKGRSHIFEFENYSDMHACRDFITKALCVMLTLSLPFFHKGVLKMASLYLKERPNPLVMVIVRIIKPSRFYCSLKSMHWPNQLEMEAEMAWKQEMEKKKKEVEGS
ncbi:hypothetical protein ISN44_As11g018980 [Arabidopsis suecica]|uniref:Uncharacterized protein n=1 Tax=Arabidopsis suecica TaxID=45249 RepID=A0A8T1Z9K5_ARASU|nr:hypothetical protein ISN44_As11g018980 [Arabidopsis suecica]